jgi:hypothetical protein
MAIARVVTFEDVSSERMEQLKSEIGGGQPPEGLDASELIVLHDPGAEKSVAIVFFDTEDAYTRGNEILDSMPTGDTPGRRTSVARYDVALRMTP